MMACGKYILSQFGPLSENGAFLVDGYVAGGTAVTVASHNFPSSTCTTTVPATMP